MKERDHNRLEQQALSSIVALELEISLTESLSADFNSSSKSDISSNESAKSNEIEESISLSGLSFTIKISDKIAFVDETHSLHAQRHGSPAVIMRTSQENNF